MFFYKENKKPDIVQNSEFRFILDVSKKKKSSPTYVIKTPFFLHIREFRSRFIHVFEVAYWLILFCLLQTRSIVQVLQAPVGDYVKFFQISPGDYFFSTLKISIYISLSFTIPYAILQLVLFFLPGLTRKEKVYIIPLFWFSIGLFYLGARFAYYVLAPAALGFFLQYGAGVIEPFLSFDEYFEFLFVLFYSTGFTFQIPTLIIVVGLLKLVSVRQMLKVWRYVALISTIFSAVLTPSTDPITQLFLSLAIMGLYLFGVGVLCVIKVKFKINL